ESKLYGRKRELNTGNFLFVFALFAGKLFLRRNHSCEANISARCIVFTFEPSRDNRPPICIRQLASPDTTALTSAFSIASILLSTIPAELSGNSTENVP